MALHIASLWVDLGVRIYALPWAGVLHAVVLCQKQPLCLSNIVLIFAGYAAEEEEEEAQEEQSSEGSHRKEPA